MTTTLNALGKTILFSYILTTMINANTQNNIDTNNASSDKRTAEHTNYQSMTTAQLEKEVEMHSKMGTLSFALGQELIKRWTNG